MEAILAIARWAITRSPTSLYAGGSIFSPHGKHALINAFVLIQTEVGKVSEVAKALASSLGIDSADEVTGPYDIICKVHAEDLVALGEKVTGAIQRIEGVTRTLTCPMTREIDIDDID